MDPKHQKQENNRLFIAIIICGALLLGWDYFMVPKAQEHAAQTEEIAAQEAESTPVEAGGVELPGAPELDVAANTPTPQTPAGEAAQVARVPLVSTQFKGSVALKGGRIDELLLPRYRTQLEDGEETRLFAPVGTRVHYFDAGWQASGIVAPDGNTDWQMAAQSALQKLTPQTPLTLTWANETGQTFARTFTLDGTTYAVHVKDSVTNAGSAPISVAHYAQVHKADGHKDTSGMGFNPDRSTFYNFLGPQAIVDGIRTEINFDDLKEERMKKVVGREGWIGMTTRYFMAAIVPEQGRDTTYRFNYSNVKGRDFYSTIVQGTSMSVPVGETYRETYTLYAGPKATEQLVKVGANLDLAVDYGWFHAIAKPLYTMVMWFNGWVGNLGVAIILATCVLKLLLFPLANKSYKAMATMKKLQPRMEQLREKYGDQREKFALEMMALYREHKVNPASGCWPLLIQIPIFFAFYKVILISFEFRHAPFVGWIQDLSAQDPYYILPVIMGVTMYIQQLLSPPMADPIQAKVMKALPIVFTFLFLMFPAGLVLYWVVNNTLSVAQQWYMTRKVYNS